MFTPVWETLRIKLTEYRITLCTWKRIHQILPQRRWRWVVVDSYHITFALKLHLRLSNTTLTRLQHGCRRQMTYLAGPPHGGNGTLTLQRRPRKPQWQRTLPTTNVSTNRLELLHSPLMTAPQQPRATTMTRSDDIPHTIRSLRSPSTRPLLQPLCDPALHRCTNIEASRLPHNRTAVTMIRSFNIPLPRSKLLLSHCSATRRKGRSQLQKLLLSHCSATSEIWLKRSTRLCQESQWLSHCSATFLPTNDPDSIKK